MKVEINGRLHTVQVLDRPARHGDYVIEKGVLKTLDDNGYYINYLGNRVSLLFQHWDNKFDVSRGTGKAHALGYTDDEVIEACSPVLIKV
jgi:hypothetical protein